MIEWKEHEHKLKYIATLKNPQERDALRNFDLLKYFKLQKMKKEVLLLECMIGLWNTAEKGFQIGSQMLYIELEDVYFLTDLSKRGPPIILSRQQGVPMPVKEYVANHFVPGSRLVGSRIVKKNVRDLPLRSVLFSITNLVGITSAHLASRSHMAYALQCVEPTLFNWSTIFLHNVKDQISRCRMGQ
jgi:hypothetical protein